jgi:antitoxin (DNA-binding transcriptional repressor) of toxin-antitoxin stability system
MKTLAISDFKTNCIAELKTLQKKGDRIQVTLRGKPIAEIRPIHPAQRSLGAQRGSMTIRGDMIHSDLEKDWS